MGLSCIMVGGKKKSGKGNPFKMVLKLFLSFEELSSCTIKNITDKMHFEFPLDTLAFI